jgi:transcriptional regulator with XRE-family HTH domain
VARPRTALSEYIGSEMQRRRWTEAGLARAAGINRSYLRRIMEGYAPGSDMMVEPSPRILRQLAEGLTQGSRDPDEAEHVYAELMDAAGYLPTVLPARENEQRVDRSVERMEKMRREFEELMEETNRRARRIWGEDGADGQA